MGCVSSSRNAVAPAKGSTLTINVTGGSMAAVELGGGSARVYPSSPSLSIVPVSPTLPTVITSTSPGPAKMTKDMTKDLPRVMSSVPGHLGGEAGPNALRSKQSLASRVRMGMGDSGQVPDAVFDNSDAPVVARPEPLVVSTTAHRITSIEQVVSAKAVAAKKRRGTVESTEIKESMDQQGHKVVNQ